MNVIAYRSQYGSANPAAIVGAGILATVASTGARSHILQNSGAKAKEIWYNQGEQISGKEQEICIKNSMCKIVSAARQYGCVKGECMDKRYSERGKSTQREELKKEIKREIKKQNRKLKIKIPWKIQKILIIIAIIALAGGAGAIGMKRYITHERPDDQTWV